MEGLLLRQVGGGLYKSMGAQPPENYFDTNCMLWYTGYPDEIAMEEWYCESYNMTCPFQYSEEPVLRLRGLCPTSALVPLGYLPVFSPKQLAGSPDDIFLDDIIGGAYQLLGHIWTQIRYNDSGEQ